MGIIDWIILVFLVVCIVFGYRKGLLGTLVQMVGLAMSFVLIGHYYAAVRHGLMLKYALNPILANILAFILIVVLLLILFKLVIYLGNKLLKLMHLSFINQALGAVFGFVNGLLVLIILSIIIGFVPSLEKRLNDPSRHRVCSAVYVIKEDLIQKAGLKGRDRLARFLEAKQFSDTKNKK